MLPACDIIFMCPIRPMRAGIRSGHMAWSGGTKNENYYVYFPHSEVKMHLMYVAYFERKKKTKETTNKGLNIFYHLQSVWLIAESVLRRRQSHFFFFCHHWGSEQGCKAIHLSLRHKLRSHFRFSSPLLDTSAAPSPTPTSGPKLLFYSRVRLQEVAHSSRLSVRLRPRVHISASSISGGLSLRTGFTPSLWHPTWSHSFVRVPFTLALQTPFPLDLSVQNTWPLCWRNQYFAIVLKWVFQVSVLNLRTYFTWLPTF